MVEGAIQSAHPCTWCSVCYGEGIFLTCERMSVIRMRDRYLVVEVRVDV